MTRFGETEHRQPRDPAWKRDELLLICEVLRQNGWKPIRVTYPEAIELSSILRALPLRSPSVRTTLLDEEEFEKEAQEGQLLYRRHRVYERNRSLRLSRIKSAIESHSVLTVSQLEGYLVR